MQESTDPRGLTRRAILTAVLGAAVVFCVDRVTKTVITGLILNGNLEILTNGTRGWGLGIISLVQHQNEGIIANLPLPIPIVVIITLIVLVIVGKALASAAKEGRILATLFLGVLIGGALGNLYDRLVMGYVFDWILLFGRSAINLADVGIVGGAVGYMLAKSRH